MGTGHKRRKETGEVGKKKTVERCGAVRERVAVAGAVAQRGEFIISLHPVVTYFFNRYSVRTPPFVLSRVLGVC